MLRGTRLGFRDPRPSVSFQVRERLEGDATTDFGAPSIPPAVDARPFTERDLDRHARILRAAWRALDRAAAAADGADLAKGPRGGGRDLDAIVAHVVGSDAGYGRMIEAKTPDVEGAAAIDTRDEIRAALLETLERAATDGIPERGPRGGARWTARYFVRRAAWHALDHAWEIEDRS